MGTDLTILTSHNLRMVTLEKVRKRFDPVLSTYSEFGQIWPKFKDDTWHAQKRISPQDPIGFEAPLGFGLSFSERLLRIYHPCRLTMFVSDQKVQQLFRSFSRDICRQVNSAFAVYLPDSGIGEEAVDWLNEGASMEEITQKLQQKAKPAKSPGEIFINYYVDNFEVAS